MANGEDTRNHPNRRVGRSELPRLSEALGNYLTNSMEAHMEDYDNPYDDDDGNMKNDNLGSRAAEEFAMSHSMPSLINQPYGEAFSELDAGEALQRYRNQRNSGKMDAESKELYADDIRGAYRNRY